MNPPYGRRIETPDTAEFYGRIGSVLKHSYGGYTAWILSGDMAALKQVALRPFRKFELLNGDIECRFQGYELYSGTRKNRDTEVL